MGSTCSVYVSNTQPNTPYDELLDTICPNLSKELSEESHHQLYRIHLYATNDYKNLLSKLKRKNLNIKGHHINAVFNLIKIEKHILTDAFISNLEKSCKLIDLNTTSFQAALKNLHQDLEQQIQIQAIENHLLHHSLTHAIEVQHRFELAIQNLNIWNEVDSFTQVIRFIVLFLVKYHDLIQIKNEFYSSIEEQTAIVCKQRLISLLNLEAHHPLTLFINYCSELFIIIGTTVIFGEQSKHTDLSRLFLDFRNLTQVFEEPISSNLVQEWQKNLSSMLLLIGICDKYPAALLNDVEIYEISKHQSIVGIEYKPRLIQKIFFEFLKKQTFFQTNSSQFYFQAFLIAVTPHIAMQFEFFAKKNPSIAHAFFSLISVCRDHLLYHNTNLSWLKTSLHQENIFNIFQEFFIHRIPQEITFCESLEDGFLVTKNHFRKHHPEALQYFNTSILKTNIRFLNALAQFFSESDRQTKFTIIEELIMNLVIQKGFIKILLTTNKEDTISSRTTVTRNPRALFSSTENNDESEHTQHLSFNPS